jgi:predicted transposase/invertase (TIGR01784 family)
MEQIPDTIKQVIINMIRNYEQNDVINKYTGISFETIEKIRAEIKPKPIKKDSIFKKIYQNKTMFLLFIQSFVKQPWVQELTEDNLEYHPSLFPEIIESDRESDIVYKVSDINNDNDIYVFIMLENQTQVDFLMPFRLLEYMIRLWRRHIQEKGDQAENKPFKLPAILPIVFYDGDQQEGWTAEREFSKKVNHHEVFQAYTPNFEYILVDLTVIGVKELEQLKNPNSLILLLDKCRTPEGLRQIREISDDFWEAVVKIAKKNGLFDLLKETVYIIMKKYHATDEVIRETIEKLNKGQVKEGMLIYSEGLDVLKAEEKGIEKGERKKAIETAINFYKLGLTVDQIAKGTGLDKKTLKEILKNVER